MGVRLIMKNKNGAYKTVNIICPALEQAMWPEPCSVLDLEKAPFEIMGAEQCEFFKNEVIHGDSEL